MAGVQDLYEGLWNNGEQDLYEGYPVVKCIMPRWHDWETSTRGSEMAIRLPAATNNLLPIGGICKTHTEWLRLDHNRQGTLSQQVAVQIVSIFSSTYYRNMIACSRNLTNTSKYLSRCKYSMFLGTGEYDLPSRLAW